MEICIKSSLFGLLFLLLFSTSVQEMYFMAPPSLAVTRSWQVIVGCAVEATLLLPIMKIIIQSQGRNAFWKAAIIRVITGAVSSFVN
jgi:hypothetical protein